MSLTEAAFSNAAIFLNGKTQLNFLNAYLKDLRTALLSFVCAAFCGSTPKTKSPLHSTWYNELDVFYEHLTFSALKKNLLHSWYFKCFSEQKWQFVLAEITSIHQWQNPWALKSILELPFSYSSFGTLVVLAGASADTWFCMPVHR